MALTKLFVVLVWTLRRFLNDSEKIVLDREGQNFYKTIFVISQ